MFSWIYGSNQSASSPPPPPVQPTQSTDQPTPSTAQPAQPPPPSTDQPTPSTAQPTQPQPTTELPESKTTINAPPSADLLIDMYERIKKIEGSLQAGTNTFNSLPDVSLDWHPSWRHIFDLIEHVPNYGLRYDYNIAVMKVIKCNWDVIKNNPKYVIFKKVLQNKLIEYIEQGHVEFRPFYLEFYGADNHVNEYVMDENTDIQNRRLLWMNLSTRLSELIYPSKLSEQEKVVQNEYFKRLDSIRNGTFDLNITFH